MYQVFLAGNLISVTSHIENDWLLSQRYHLYLSSISSFSCNIYICYELNDFLINSLNLFFLFSFDEIIIPPLSVFVNTFLYISFNFLLYCYLLCIYIVHYIYFILISDNFKIFQHLHNSSPYQPPYLPHTNKQTGPHPYSDCKYSRALRHVIHAQLLPPSSLSERKRVRATGRS